MRRQGDVPGEEIPRIYFDYLRRRDGRALARVLEHNRVDILSLAALAALACQWVEDDRAEDPRDVYCLARVLERARRFERSEAQYRRVLARGGGAGARGGAARLAARAKRRGDHPARRRSGSRRPRRESWLAMRELAVHHEHRSRDLTTALAIVDAGLGRLEEGADGAFLCADALQPGRPRSSACRRAAPPSTSAAAASASRASCGKS